MKQGALRAVLGLLTLLLSLAAPKPLGATSVTLTFVGLPDRTILTNQYPGITFSNAIVLSAGITLNEIEFPSLPGTNVASDNGGPITITFSSTVQSVSAYFTYSQTLTMTAYDMSNNLITSVTSRYSNNEAISGVSGSTPGEVMVINVGASVSIAKVVITGAAGGTSFTMDELTVDSFTQCDINNAGSANVASVQGVIKQALGLASPTKDLNGDGVVNVADVQLEIYAALGLGCSGTLPTSIPPAPVLESNGATAAIRRQAGQVGLASSGDSIDAAGAAPSAIIQGTAQPTVFSAHISDPKVIPAGVTVLQVNSGVESVSGTLQAEGNAVFSLTQSFPSAPTGTLTFSVSAPYIGVLRRIQTPTFPVTIVPAASISGWSTAPVNPYFTMSVPPELSVVGDFVSGGYDTQTYDLVLSDGTVAAWLYIYTNAQWAALRALQTDAEVPLLLSTGGNYVCAYVVSQNNGNTIGYPEGALLADLNQALATVTAN